MRKKTHKFICILALVAMITVNHSVLAVAATEGTSEAPGSVILPTVEEEYVSVLLPTIGDESPFDFYIDPQGLIYETNADLHGGGTVEEGANILFHNHNSEYDFSKYSDRLKVVNQSNVPVVVTITASASDIGSLKLKESNNFLDDAECSMYLAIVDDEGNEKPISEDCEVSMSVEMRRAPDNAFTYRYDEDTQTYRLEPNRVDDVEFDSYSFGLVGYCNPDGTWEKISATPKINVTWRVEPVLSEEVGDKEDEAVLKDEEVSNTEDKENDSELISVEEADNTEDSKSINDEDAETNDEGKTTNEENSETNDDEESSASRDTENSTDDEVDKMENKNDMDDVTNDTSSIDATGASEILDQKDTSDEDKAGETDSNKTETYGD